MTVIDGRTVNQRDCYTIQGKINNEKCVLSFIEDNYAWFAPCKITKRETIETPVYNFEVKNDNSYVVENTIVHNCNDFSHAGKRLGFNSSTTHNLTDDITDGNSRGTLYKSFVAVVDRVRPKMFVAENVYGLLTMKEQPIKIIMKEIKSGDKIKIARSLGEDKLEFVNISSMLSLNPIDGTISDIVQ